MDLVVGGVDEIEIGDSRGSRRIYDEVSVITQPIDPLLSGHQLIVCQLVSPSSNSECWYQDGSTSPRTFQCEPV